MKNKLAVITFVTIALTAMPFAPSFARDNHSRGDHNEGLFLGLFAAGVTGAAIALATAPHEVILESPPPAPIYVVQPPAPAYYSYAPIYRHRPVHPYRQVVYYSAPQRHAYPAYYAYPR
jgi:hypothetical protein